MSPIPNGHHANNNQRGQRRAKRIGREFYGAFRCSLALWEPYADRLEGTGRKIDFGLVDGGIDNPYVTHEPLMSYPLVCAMPPDHPFASKSRIEPQDLDQVPFVALDSDTSLGHRVEEMLEAYGARPTIGIVANATQTICEFVAAGRGVALLHPLTLSGMEGRLIARRFEPEILYNFQLCRSADSRNTRLVDIFVRELRDISAEISQSML